MAMFHWPPDGHVICRFRPFPDQECCTLSVQRTFLHLACGENPSDMPPNLPVLRSRSAPPRIRCAAEATMAMAGTAGAAAEGFPARLVLQLEPMIPEPSLAEIPPAAASPAEPAAGTLELHAAGLCEPCRFYFGEEVRCHFGDRCRKCHFCTRHEAKKRWRMLGYEKRQLKRAQNDAQP
ncbi:unnamed protein product [Durusdinium trenchii]|uniref:C3H1-type domain-containing protein n=1 Tax=Durusdinium trenchii TaxID=1381693 RepID=A0ABP0PBU0_9DINO